MNSFTSFLLMIQSNLVKTQDFFHKQLQSETELVTSPPKTKAADTLFRRGMAMLPWFREFLSPLASVIPGLNPWCCHLFMFLSWCLNSPILPWPLALPPLSAHSLIWIPNLIVVSRAPKPQHPMWLEVDVDKAGFSLLTSTTISFDVVFQGPCLHTSRRSRTHSSCSKNGCYRRACWCKG